MAAQRRLPLRSITLPSSHPDWAIAVAFATDRNVREANDRVHGAVQNIVV